MEFIDLKSQQKRIRDSIEQRISAVLDHGRYILGPEVSSLEEELCRFVDCEHTLGVSSGTDALLIALMALDIGPGDEVITVPYTWISTAEVVGLVGARTVFVDIDSATWNMCPAKLREAITDRTKAIIPVGIYGQAADMTAINEVAKEAGGIPVIEDAAQCFGATHHGRRAGGLSPIGCTSFFPSKPLGGYGDGGAIFASDGELAEKMRSIHIHGQAGPNFHPHLGVNGRLDSIQAAVVLAKLEIFEEEIQLRQEVADRYGRLLEGIEGIEMQHVSAENTSVWAQYTILSEKRDEIREKLSEHDIPSVAYYSVPLHLQPVFGELGYGEGSFPETERIARLGLSLPMSPYVSEEDQERIARVIAEVC